MQIKRFVNLCPHIVFVPIFILTIFVACKHTYIFFKKSLPVLHNCKTHNKNSQNKAENIIYSFYTVKKCVN